MEMETLVMHVTVIYLGDLGYGSVYKGQVVQVVSGALDEREITLTILAGDKPRQAFIDDHLDTGAFEMGCIKKDTNVPYVRMPISGFVDQNRTAWEIAYLAAL